MARWVVVGASGFIGGAIASLLEQQGQIVTRAAAPRLTIESTSSEQQVVAIVRDRLGAFGAFAEILRGHDIVVNAAGVATPDATDSPTLYGANAALPVLLAHLAAKASVRRLVHVSSAAVQGRSEVLDASWRQSPFSPYSASKALGERALKAILDDQSITVPTVCIVRATSVQGDARRTTRGLVAFAHSRFSSVAGEGDAPSPVSTAQGLARFVMRLGLAPGCVPSVAVQPWEGMTVRDVLVAYGGKEPLRLPSGFCRVAVHGGYLLARLGIRRIEPMVRRVEVVWFGQRIAIAECRE